MFSTAVHEIALGRSRRRRFAAGSLGRMVSLAAVLLSVLYGSRAFAQAPSSAKAAEMERWLAATANQEGTIGPRTRITMRNWRQFRQYMPMGMQELFEGRYFWMMPKDVEMDLGPTVIYPLTAGYRLATEKHSAAVRVVHLPNGHNDIVN